MEVAAGDRLIGGSAVRRRKLTTIEGEPESAVSSEGVVLIGRIRAVTGVDANGLGADPVYDVDVYAQDGVRTVAGVRPMSRNFDNSTPPTPALLIKAWTPPRRILVIVDGDEWDFWIPETFAVGPCPTEAP